MNSFGIQDDIDQAYDQMLTESNAADRLGNWMGNSVIDFEMYHGTDADFTEFKHKHIGSNFELDDIGFFFTSDRDSANASRASYPNKSKYRYTDEDKVAAESGNIMSVFLRIEKPLTPSMIKEWEYYHKAIGGFDQNRDTVTKLLKSGKYDGFVAKGEDGHIMAVVLDPNQIKSIDNKGGWSKDSNDLYESTLNDNFNQWFGDSKVVDDSGNPLVVYHGTQGDFDAFERVDVSNDTYGTNSPDHNLGFFLTDSKEMADFFSNGGKTMSLYANISNPYVIDHTHPQYDVDNEIDSVQIYFNEIDDIGGVDKYRSKLESNGHDGVVLKGNVTNYYNDGTYNIMVAFNPNQIKSVENIGEWNPGSSNINESTITEYPLAPRDEWWGDGDYEARGGKLVYMTPDEYLDKATDIELNEDTQENVDDLKDHIMTGRPLDPLALYGLDKSNVQNSDGRHRAIMSKQLGFTRVPVLDFT